MTEARERHQRELAEIEGRYALSLKEIERLRARTKDFIAIARRVKMDRERYALASISDALDDLDDYGGWNPEYRQRIRVYLAMYGAVLDGLVKDGEWLDLLERS